MKSADRAGEVAAEWIAKAARPREVLVATYLSARLGREVALSL